MSLPEIYSSKGLFGDHPFPHVDIYKVGSSEYRALRIPGKMFSSYTVVNTKAYTNVGGTEVYKYDEPEDLFLDVKIWSHSKNAVDFLEEKEEGVRWYAAFPNHSVYHIYIKTTKYDNAGMLGADYSILFIYEGTKVSLADMKLKGLKFVGPSGDIDTVPVEKKIVSENKPLPKVAYLDLE